MHLKDLLVICHNSPHLVLIPKYRIPGSYSFLIATPFYAAAHSPSALLTDLPTYQLGLWPSNLSWSSATASGLDLIEAGPRELPTTNSQAASHQTVQLQPDCIAAPAEKLWIETNFSMFTAADRDDILPSLQKKVIEKVHGKSWTQLSSLFTHYD